MPFRIDNIDFKKRDSRLDEVLQNLDYLLIPVIEKPASESQESGESKIYRTDFLEELDTKFQIYRLFQKEEFHGKANSSFLLPATDRATLIFAGLGNPKEILYNREWKLSRMILGALRGIKKKILPSLGIAFDVLKEYYRVYDLPYNQKTLLVNLLASLEEYTYHSLEAKEVQKAIENLIIYDSEEVPETTKQFALAVMRARAGAKDIVNMPSNVKTTATFVEKARSLEKLGLKVEIIDDVAWIRNNMPCFYMVAKGSLASDPPKWIKVRYTPKTPAKRKIALIGKSIVFDTGGYQVKPDEYMNTMKADNTGGATVLAIIEEVARLQLPDLEITSYLPVTANKIDSDSMLPDSIVVSASGKRVEIRHTDAEGRLTLIDAIHHAEKDGNDLFFTIATLTGSAARAVGPRIALMSTQKEKRKEFEKYLEEINEPFQSLEIEDEDYEDIKSKLDGADIRNLGSEKYRGAQTAASFIFSGLSSTEKTCFHLDIAGGDLDKEEKATGIAVKGVLYYLWNLSYKS